jgi:hypothetical protein
MMRLGVGLLTVIVGVVFLAGPGNSQEKKAKGQLPPGWKKLDLTKEQEVKIRGIAADYQMKINALEKQIDTLKVSRKRDQVKVLNEEQKEKLRKLVLGDDKEKAKTPPKEK